MTEYELMYFSDPMCSWCYGFGPAIEELQAEYSERMPLQMILGGLRPDEERPLPQKMAQEISHHWEAVHEASGRPFHFAFFESHPDFIYNTAPACRAVVAAGRGESPRPMQFQHELQRLFYGEGQDPTKVETFEAAAVAAGLDREEFRRLYDDPETETITRQNFELTRAFGINGYPTLVLREVEGEEEKHILVSRGFLPYVELKQRVQMILNREVELVPETE
ncbi:MAG: DsbA family protein [bacterium]|nr:DsbA family protein [bacterium]